MVKDYRRIIDTNLISMAGLALRFSPPSPRFIKQLLTLAANQRRAAKLRKEGEARGIFAPSFMAISLTQTCNLACAGCYARTLHPPRGKELSTREWMDLLEEASELGVGIVTVLGGEPFTRPDLLEIVARFPRLLFLVFTNGTLIDPAAVKAMRGLVNLVPMLSIEGFEAETDERRGKGVYGGLGKAACLLRQAGIVFGSSITASAENYDSVTNEDFVSSLHRQGSRVFFYIEFLPAEPGSEASCLSPERKRGLSAFLDGAKARVPAFFFDFPGDEYQFGGCLSAGRGFIHVSAEGRFEPCPFSPYSDTGVRTHTLEEALCSPLFVRIRELPEGKSGTSGNCELWEKRLQVEELEKLV